MDDAELIGRTLTHYRIIERVAAGGMGIVFRAQDLRLGRNVALKLLPPVRAVDARSRERFRREALLLARLNHPHIATIYDIDSQDQLHFIVMELVAGATLAEQLKHGPLSEGTLLSVGEQIASALEAAHEARVVHRDLKPSNIIVTSREQVKVLDFGLATLVASGSESTLEEVTETGHVVGTLPYMAPEQIYGEPADPRTDLYALGAVLYEMATGRKPFPQIDRSRLTHAILHDTPPLPHSLRTDISSGTESVILRALEKDQTRRYQSARELHADLQHLRATIGIPTTRPSRHVRRAAGLLVLGVMLALGYVVKSVVDREHPAPADLVATAKQVTYAGSVSDAALSPDGEFLAYVEQSDGRDRVMTLDRAGGQAIEVLRTHRCLSVRWNHDGTSILAVANDSPTSPVVAMLIPRLGGPARQVADHTQFFCLSPDGSRYASTFHFLKYLDLTHMDTNRTERIQLKWPFLWILGLDWSPRHDELLVHTRDARGWEEIWSVSADGVRQERVLLDSVRIYTARWSPTERAVYYLRQDGGAAGLYRTRIGSRGRSSTALLMSGLQTSGPFAISRNGRTLLYVRTTEHSNIWLLRRPGIDTVLRRLDSVALTTGTRWDDSPSLSPDRTRVAFTRLENGRHIFEVPIEGGTAQQITFMEGETANPVWSPDGKQLAFISNKGGSWNVWRVPSKSGVPKLVPGGNHSGERMELAWAPSSRIVYQKPGNRELHVVDPITGAGSALLRANEKGWMFCGRPAPSSKVAAFWNQQRRGVYVLSPDAARTLLLTDSPLLPIRWSDDEKWIYVLDWNSDPQRVLRVSSDDGDAQPWATLPFGGKTLGIDVSSDGSLLVCGIRKAESDAWIVENFAPRGLSSTRASR
jgi:Tol biopolymer transport system component